MKKIIILQHGGGELANQLWTFASVYAYCKEKGYDCRNYSFFEYGHYFNIPVGNKIIELLFFLPFRNYHGRRHAPRTRFFRYIYKMYVKIILILHNNQSVSSVNTAGKKYFLPPTEENAQLEAMVNKNDTVYFTGWLFRNPKGLEKYQADLAAYFTPRAEYSLPTKKKITDVRKMYKNIIGVHIRQSDYRTHKSGEYFIPQERIRTILDEYLTNFKKTPEETLFITTSDEPIEENLFKGLNIQLNKGNALEDLYTLSLCDTIIGSNSSFGNFAAYLGNKSHIVFQKKTIDWKYYNGKDKYFIDKHSVMYL
ncbi:MAG: alpha-1,2-fucosyltransferase [Parcubacteria group bacterium]|nr:alpha-1,2-fucosyltransferase [Parcubacteria group bacterium]